ncbi:MAG: glycoside hydrolase family 2 protein [Prevotella sp.]
MTINSGWKFKLDADTTYAWVNIPHTYNLDAYNVRNYYRGKAEYRKTLAITDYDDRRCYFLRFEAVNKYAEITVNGEVLARHSGGYSSFVVDMTKVAKEENEIVVRVDNSNQDITPLWADFTFWGGIYRDVWLVSTPMQHISLSDYGSKGIFVATPNVSEKEATMEVKVEIGNDADKEARVVVRNAIIDPQGQLLQSKEKKLKVNANGIIAYVYKSEKIANPQLWSPETPRLYRIVTTVIDAQTGEVLDEVTTKTGLRFFAFDAQKGFMLNGKPYKLRGVNRHQDQWPVGVALDDEAHRRDVQLMKDFGCNFIRISHYPQDDALLDACDELGLLAWEEIPVVDKVPDDPLYDNNCEENLVEMIRQHYNHASVIAWGYMNEILLIAPRPGTSEWPACKERTVRLAQRLEKRLKEEDPYRVSVMAYNMDNTYNEIGLDLIDVTGWNLYQGWYVNKLEDFDKWCYDQHQRYPSRPMIISEWGAGSDRRLHSDSPKAFDFSIEYQQRFVEHYLPFIEGKEWISGCAYWNFIDFNVAERQESMPRVNNKGLFYNDRSPKDVAYYIKAMWRKDIPVVHIATRDWAIRHGEKGKKHTIKVYSNCDEVELSVNGKSCGTKRVENCFATFSVPLEEGRSILMAVGSGKNGEMNDVATIDNRHVPATYDGGELAINVGSNCYYTSSVNNLTWLPDRQYEPGKWGWIDGKQRSTTSEVFNTVDGPIYQTWLEDLTEYRIDAPAGIYEVELLTTDCTASEERGIQANRVRHIIRNQGNCIEIKFSPSKGMTSLSGIKVRRL